MHAKRLDYKIDYRIMKSNFTFIFGLHFLLISSVHSFAMQQGDYPILTPKQREAKMIQYNLILAATDGDLDQVNHYLELGADPNWQNPGTITWRDEFPLLGAAINGNVDIVKRLLQAGADPNQRNRGGHSILMFMTWHPEIPAEKHIEIIKLLIRANANPNAAISITAQTPLMEAMQSNRPQITHCFIKSGANLFCHDYRNRRALLLAAEKNWLTFTNAQVYLDAVTNVFDSEKRMVQVWLLTAHRLHPKLPKDVRILIFKYITANLEQFLHERIHQAQVKRTLEIERGKRIQNQELIALLTRTMNANYLADLIRQQTIWPKSSSTEAAPQIKEIQ